MDHRYRFSIVFPSKMYERQVKALEKEAQVEKRAIEQACHALAKRTFACEADAQAECLLFSQKHRGHSIPLTLPLFLKQKCFESLVAENRNGLSPRKQSTV
ncbi:hypothetical protein GJ688_10475 [Heliobacillus mobilis]|uniref:Uncharacterized protein n=1 Tax=Heliobacterium mobile TaxID=28064 RepID=A0A6I3SL41_HELMO|nr:hypothetical protein [Heliobacterium mobile]MTV49402.1 hypothetical protein [Heliobacterium mobile]